MTEEKVFCDGMICRPPNEGAPEFVRFKISIKVDEFVNFLANHRKPDGWINIDVKKSKMGKIYAELNRWPKGRTNESNKSQNDEEISDSEIPF